MGDQPRWPAGTPVAPGGKGPGGGRSRVARAIGAPVPVVVPDRGGVLMTYAVPAPGRVVDWPLSQSTDRDTRLIALLDALIGNTDRTPPNVIPTGNGPVGIDHGGASFWPYRDPLSRSRVLAIAGEGYFGRGELAGMRQRIGGLDLTSQQRSGVLWAIDQLIDVA